MCGNTPVLHIQAEHNVSESGHECPVMVPGIQNRMCTPPPPLLPLPLPLCPIEALVLSSKFRAEP